MTSMLPDSDLPIRSLTQNSQESVHFPRSSSTSTRREDRLEVPTQILSPMPRRHFLDTSISQQWISGHAQPSSPTSSRAVSPTSARSPATRRMSIQRMLELDAGNELQRTLRTRYSSLQLLPENEKSRTHNDSMAKRWMRWMHQHGAKDLTLPAIIMASVLIKIFTGLGTYSGFGTPPMFGDYEAQRHWMELTVHLPIHKWYTYDLQYWGLDYPPLTAYVSWLCGIIGSWVDPTWFALDISRGIETPGSKLYLRLTVLALDSIFYVIPIVLFSRVWHKGRSKRTQNLAILMLMLQPALLLIDFGHFQYNGIMLGLTIQALNFFASGNDVLGAVCFVLSLEFKQMALYYAPAIGTYLLAKCIYLGQRKGMALFSRLGLTTILTFVVLFLPFLPHPTDISLSFPPVIPPTLLQPIIRIFPFNRGLFEDKVANFWCATNVVLKWKQLISDSAMLVKLSTAMTAISFLPSVAILLTTAIRLALKNNLEDVRKPNVGNDQILLPLLPYTIVNTSMSFFLFSFQVHEKTILLPLMPLTLAFSGALSGEHNEMFGFCALVNNAAVFSMWPLLQKDRLSLQYVSLLILWCRTIGYNPFAPGFSVINSLRGNKTVKDLTESDFIDALGLLFHSAAIFLHILEYLITPPSRYPDLFPVLNVLLCTPIFALTWIWSIRKCFEVSWAIGGVAHEKKTETTKEEDSVRTRAMSSIGTGGARRRKNTTALQQVFKPPGLDATDVPLQQPSSLS